MARTAIIKTGRVPLLLPTACFICGLLCGFAGIAPTWAMALIIPALISFFFSRPALGACIIALSVGWCDASLQMPRPLPQRLINGTHTLTGVVDRTSELPTKGVTGADVLIDSVDGKAVNPRRVHLTVVAPRGDISVTDRVKWRSSLEPVRPPALPEMTDRSMNMRRRGVSATSIVRPDSLISVSEEPGIINDLQRCRGSLQGLLLKSGLSSGTMGMLNALLLGDTSWLPQQQRDQYSSAGLSHILALSGMHVALIAMLVGWLLWPLSMAVGRRPLEIAVVVILWLYACVTGLAPSVVRAVTMGTVFVMARLLQRPSSPYNSLCLAALVILVPSPMSLYSYGFQLSFAAVLAIVTFSAAFNPVSQRRHPYIHGAVAYVTVSISAMLGAGVVAAYHFHTFPLYFLLSATVAALLMPWICGMGLLEMIVTALGLSVAPLEYLTDSLVAILDWTAAAVSSLPGASIGGIYMPAPLLWLCLLTIALLGIAIHLKSRASYLALSLSIVATAAGWMLRKDYTAATYRTVILPYRGHQVMMHREGTQVTLVTDAANPDTLLLRARFLSDFDEYVIRSGVSAVSIVTIPGDSIEPSSDSRRCTGPK